MNSCKLILLGFLLWGLGGCQEPASKILTVSPEVRTEPTPLPKPLQSLAPILLPESTPEPEISVLPPQPSPTPGCDELTSAFPAHMIEGYVLDAANFKGLSDVKLTLVYSEDAYQNYLKKYQSWPDKCEKPALNPQVQLGWSDAKGYFRFEQVLVEVAGFIQIEHPNYPSQRKEFVLPQENFDSGAALLLQITLQK